MISLFFFFNDTATTEIYTLSLHDALPICECYAVSLLDAGSETRAEFDMRHGGKARLWINGSEAYVPGTPKFSADLRDRKSTRLNSSHANISYAVFCLKKKNIQADVR